MVVMETLTGATLSVEIADGPPPEAADVAHLGLQLGSAVAYLHRHGVLHLDLKPSNVIAEAGRAKLIDLSLVRPPGDAPAGIGTWLYLSPEQARGGELGPAADIWGLGAVLFEAASGEGPFDDDPDAWVEPSVGDRHRRAGPALPPARRPSAPRPKRQADARLRPGRADRRLPRARSCRATFDSSELMVRLEQLAELPDRERRWTRAANAHSASR